jgi:hypothetical protein
MLMSFEADPITCFHYCFNLKTLFMGTEKGEVMSFSWPNKPENLLVEHSKKKLHSGSIVSMLVSSDLKEFVTIGEDNSLCISHLIYLRNLKRLEGLELIEYLSGGLSINFDFLLHKGICHYTHSEWSSKLDSLKDHEDETLNINFIMPE